MDMGWFRRHLNWTWIFGVILFYLLQILIGFVYGVVNAGSVFNAGRNKFSQLLGMAGCVPGSVHTCNRMGVKRKGQKPVVVAVIPVFIFASMDRE